MLKISFSWQSKMFKDLNMLMFRVEVKKRNDDKKTKQKERIKSYKESFKKEIQSFKK